MGKASREVAQIRQGSEFVSGVLPVAQAATAVGFVAAAATGATGILVASAPVSASLLLVGLFAAHLKRMHGANKEFSLNCVAIMEETTRMYHIIQVIKEISQKKKTENKNSELIYPQLKSLSFAKVDVWVGVVLRGLVKMAGPEAFDQIEIELKSTRADPSFIALFEKFKKETKPSSFAFLRRKLRRILQPIEQLRMLVRDVIILSIFFQILLGEFHILLMANTTDTWLQGNPIFQGFKQQIDPTYVKIEEKVIAAAATVGVGVATEQQREEGDPGSVSPSPVATVPVAPNVIPQEFANANSTLARGGTRKRKAKFERKTYKIKY